MSFTVVGTMVGVDKTEASYRRIREPLWRSLLAYTGDPEVASDALAEAFSQCLRRQEQIENIDGWVWKASFRIAAALLKRRSKPTPQRAPEVHMDRSVVEFLSQLEGLSDQQRAIVALRYVANYKPSEIADLIGSSPGSVRVQLHRAHVYLRHELEGSK